MAEDLTLGRGGGVKKKNEERTGGTALIKQGNLNPHRSKMERIALLSVSTFYCGDKKLFESQPSSPPCKVSLLTFCFF